MTNLLHAPCEHCLQGVLPVMSNTYLSKYLILGNVIKVSIFELKMAFLLANRFILSLYLRYVSICTWLHGCMIL